MRAVFLYSVGMSWDARRPEEPESRRPRQTALWKDDFTLFMTTMESLVTAANENYLAIFPGRTKRPGAGLMVEAGISCEAQILDIVRTSGKGWRCKRAVA